MNDATGKLEETLADIRNGVEKTFTTFRPSVPYAEPQAAAEPYQPEHEAQTAPETDPAMPASLIDWIYLLHGQLAYLDANMLRIERFLGMGDRPAAP